MPGPPKYSLRFAPGVFKNGDQVRLRPEFFAVRDKPCQVKLVEVDDEGGNPTDIATFQVKVSDRGGAQPGKLRFVSAERAGEAGTPAETAPRFQLQFEGTQTWHEVAIDRPFDPAEGPWFEVGLVVLDDAGKEVYPAGHPKPYYYAHCSVGSGYAKLDCKALNFHNDSAVVLSDGAYVLYGVLDYARQNQAKSLLVLGHTDAVGSPADNDALSDLRAKAVLHLLRGSLAGDLAANRAAWVETCKKRWCTRDAQEFLGWVGGFSWAGKLEPGELTSDRGGARQSMPQATAKALLQFDARFRFQFEAGPDPAEPTAAQVAGLRTVPDAFWAQMFDVYSDYLRQNLSVTRRDLDTLLQKLAWLDPSSDATKAIGCGQRYPLVAEKAGGTPENRRIEFLFFTRGAEKPASLGRDDLKPLYDAKKWRVDPIDCPDDKVPPEITITPPRTKDVLYVIDVSGSMTATDGLRTVEYNWRLSRVKRAMERLLGALAPDALVNILAFGGSASHAADAPRVVIEAWKENALTRLDPSAIEWVKALTTRGGTPTFDALMRALRETTGPGGAPAPDELTVVLLSDGAPDPRPGKSAEETRLAILSEVKARREARRPRWKIDTFGFTAGDGGRGFNDFMQKLATQNGGLYTAL